MAPVQKALWYVESHSRDGLSLEAVARASCVSPYHLTRSFAEVFGISLMRYTRQRRLSEAAKQLAAGAPDILSIAFDYGYGSHEAFSRAFKKEFGVTPERVRTLADLSLLQLKEPIVMDSTQLPRLNPPREETLPALAFAGLVERYDCQSSAGIPNQWQRASPLLGSISPLVSQDAYGICFNFDETDGKFDYMAGVPVEQGTTLPRAWCASICQRISMPSSSMADISRRYVRSSQRSGPMPSLRRIRNPSADRFSKSTVPNSTRKQAGEVLKSGFPLSST